MPWAVRTVLGRLLGIVALVWLRTLRLRVRVDPALLALPESVPWVLCFWHGTQWPLLAWKRRRSTVVLVSLSKDGALQTGALRSIGLKVVRGSSSRGGVRGLAALIRTMKKGADAAFAVDGPRGPLHEVKDGAITAAAQVNGVLVPMGVAGSSGRVFERAWDRYFLAWPFSRVVIVLGGPVDPRAVDARSSLKRAIVHVNEAASEELASYDVTAGNDVHLLGK